MALLKDHVWLMVDLIQLMALAAPVEATTTL
jgi:hypothetical protein